MPWFQTGALAAALVATSGCEKSRGSDGSPPPEPPHETFTSIPGAPLQGKLRGVEFTMGDARYSIDRRLGYETIDILLSAGKAERPCGELSPKNGPSVWLRRRGSAPIAAAELRIGPNQQDDWEVHYQLRDRDQWLGSSNASALLRLQPTEKSTTVSGQLAACFGDGHGSCVAGSFAARQCPVRLDMPVRGSEPAEQLPPASKGTASGARR